jgi:hypothetical protein
MRIFFWSTDLYFSEFHDFVPILSWFCLFSYHTVFVFFIIKPTRHINFPNLFWQETVHVSGSSCAHHQEFFTVHLALVPSWPCSKAVYKPVWHMPVPNVQWKTPDDGQRNCPKHVRVSWQNKFGKLVRLVGCTIKKFVTMHGHMNVKFVFVLSV